MEPKPHILDILETYKTLQQVVADVKFVPVCILPLDKLVSDCIWESLAALERMAINHKLEPKLPEDIKCLYSGIVLHGILNEVIEFLILMVHNSKDSEPVRESETGFKHLHQESKILIEFSFELKELRIPIPSSLTYLNWIVNIKAASHIRLGNPFIGSFKKNVKPSIPELEMGKTAPNSFAQGLTVRSTAKYLGTTIHKLEKKPSFGIASQNLAWSKTKISNPFNPSLNHQEENLRFNKISPYRIKQNLPRTGESNHTDQTSFETVMCCSFVRDRCLLLREAQLDKWSVRELSNLFTNFGNIERVIYSTQTRTCLFVYHSQNGVLNALNCLSGLNSNYLELDLLPNPSVEKLATSLAKEEVAEFIPRKRFISSETGLPHIVNPVSKTLHVTFYSEVPKPSLSDLQLIQVFSQVVAPVRLKRESGRRKKNMWFVEFENSEQALKVLMQFHNREVSGGAIRLSFTKNLA